MTTTLTGAQPWLDYAAAVRSALSDLTADEVDDLTDGLEADLAERADDPLAPALGAPADYAAELRAAAGIPERRTSSSFATAVSSIQRVWAEFVHGATRHPAIAGTVSFLVSLRPVWWIYRAWVVYLAFAVAFDGRLVAFPGNIADLIVLALAILLSVQFGRGRWLRWTWMRVILVLASIAVVFASPFVDLWVYRAFEYGAY